MLSDHPDSNEPGPNQDNDSDDASNENSPESGRSVLRRLRNEFALEVFVAVVCFALAFGLTFKVVVAVVMTCLRFAIPDFITAWLVFRSDPDWKHGTALACLFVGTGMARASAFAFVTMLIVAFITGCLNAVNVNFLITGIQTALVCVFGFLICTFPPTLIAYLISAASRTKLSFAGGLTRLRRAPESKRGKIRLDIERSIGKIGIASGISLAILITSSLFFFPANVVVGPSVLWVILLAFTLPFAWFFVFVTTIAPSSRI